MSLSRVLSLSLQRGRNTRRDEDPLLLGPCSHTTSVCNLNILHPARHPYAVKSCKRPASSVTRSPGAQAELGCFKTSCRASPPFLQHPSQIKRQTSARQSLPHVCMRSSAPPLPTAAVISSTSEQTDFPSLQQFCERQLIRLINLHNVLPLLQVRIEMHSGAPEA